MAEIGTILGGRYRLVELLGQGGMARIYRGHDTQLDRDVAIKILRPEYGRDPDFGSRFRHEAQAAASLNHPNIVCGLRLRPGRCGAVHRHGARRRRGSRIDPQRSGALPPRQAARITAEAARALHAAHQRGIVHRDVKPGNIMIDRDGRVKVTDFGIARAVAEAQMTLPGTTLGSVHYFSPEQARGDQTTPASDIYSLGIVLYELLTGHRPWEADSAAAVAMARLAGPPPDPSTLRAGIPTDLVAIDRKALATEPPDRWTSASSFAAALEAFLAGGAVPGVAAGVAGTAGAATIAAGAGALAGASVSTSATARPNPAAIPYAPDAYVSDRPAATPMARRVVREPVDEPDEERRSSPAVWAAGIVALLILAAAGFLVFRLLSGGGGAPAPVSQVTVPNFVGKSLTDAQALAAQKGIEVTTAGVQPASGQVADTVLSQDPAAGATINTGGIVKLTLVAGQQTAAVPDLRGKTETDAFNLLAAAGLRFGVKTEVFDPVVPAGQIVSQSPPGGSIVNAQTPVDYSLSKGPEPSASASPSPSPTPPPTPSPTPPPTPTPTPPPPTPTPPPANITVADYRCITLAEATAAITGDGFTLGTVTPEPAGYTAAPDSIVIDQNPKPGVKRPPGTAIDLTVYDPASLATCPP